MKNHLRMDHWVGEGISDSAIIILKANCSDEVLGASIKKLLHVVLVEKPSLNIFTKTLTK